MLRYNGVMADTTNDTKVLHRITVTVEMDTEQDPQAVLFAGKGGSPDDWEPPVYGVDVLEDAVRIAMDKLAGELGGYTFRVSVRDEQQAFPALDLDLF